MTVWAKLDDSFHDHPKVECLSNEAIGVYCVALSYSGDHLTDGHVNRGWVKRRAGRRIDKIAGQLVDAGLWEPNGDGWQIHDFLRYNPSREQVMERRKADRRRKASP